MVTWAIDAWCSRRASSCSISVPAPTEVSSTTSALGETRNISVSRDSRATNALRHASTACWQIGLPVG